MACENINSSATVYFVVPDLAQVRVDVNAPELGAWIHNCVKDHVK